MHHCLLGHFSLVHWYSEETEIKVTKGKETPGSTSRIHTRHLCRGRRGKRWRTVERRRRGGRHDSGVTCTQVRGRTDRKRYTTPKEGGDPSKGYDSGSPIGTRPGHQLIDISLQILYAPKEK